MTPEEKAAYAAKVFSDRRYRGHDIWMVELLRVKVDAYFAEGTHRSFAKEMMLRVMARDEESITVRPHMGSASFNADEAYLIARSLEEGGDRPQDRATP